jgi:hypothetical protein
MSFGHWLEDQKVVDRRWQKVEELGMENARAKARAGFQHQG